MKQFIQYMKEHVQSSKRLGNKGFSFVELICAIAILAAVTASIGGIMVSSAQNYQNGTVEVELQQEAQLTANQIADLVIDTTSEVTYRDSATAKELEIRQSDKCYKITYNATDEKIVYSEYMVYADGSSAPVGDENQLMAEGVVDFEVDIPTGTVPEADGSYKLNFLESGSMQLRMKFARNERAYESWYTITARNGLVEENAMTANATLITEPELTMEPNQTYQLNATVIGPMNTSVTWSVENATDGQTQVLWDATLNAYILKVGENAVDSDAIKLKVVTNAKADDNITPLATKYVDVHIRRVDNIDLTGNSLVPENVQYKSGAQYRVDAALTGTALEQVLGAAYDTDYVDPYQVQWTYSLVDESGNAVSNISDYFEFSEGRDGQVPYVIVTLKQDLGAMTLTATAKALHPAGTNKAATAYVGTDIIDTWQLKNPNPGGTIPDGKELNGVKIIPVSLNAFNPKYTSAVDTTGFTNEELATDLIYEWSVDKTEWIDSYPIGTSGKNLELIVKELAENSDKVITIKLKVTSQSLGKSVEDTITYLIPKVGDRGDSYLERGKDDNSNIQLFFEPYEFQNVVGNEDTCWEIYICDEYGNKIDNPGVNITDYVTLKAYVGSFHVNITTGLPAGQDYYVKCIIHLVEWTGATWDYERVIYIPAVDIIGHYVKTEWVEHTQTYTSCVQYTMYGFNINKWKYLDGSSDPMFYTVEAVDLQYEAPAGINVTSIVPEFSPSYEIDQENNGMAFYVNFKITLDGSDNYHDLKQVVVKSMTVKISSKEDPSVYDYATVVFTNDY